MAGTFGNQNAVGNSGGKSLNDRKLAADVRNLTLKQIYKLLSTDRAEMSDYEKELYKQVFVKLAGTVLPRLNEHTGEDGGDLIIKQIQYARSNNPVPLPPEGLPVADTPSVAESQV